MRVAILFSLLFFFPGNSSASPELKKLILTDCTEALREATKVSEAQMPEIFDYLERVLELSTSLPQLPYDASTRAMGLTNREFLNAVRPNRDLDSKICAASFANAYPQHALQLLPGLLRLESDPLLSEDTRGLVLSAIRSSLKASIPGAKIRTEIASKAAAELNSKNAFTMGSLLLELFPESLPTIKLLLFSTVELSRVTAEKALRLIDPSSKTFAEIALNHLPESDQAFRERALSSIKSYGSTSPEALILSFRVGLDSLKFSLPLELIGSSGEDSLKAFISSPDGQSEIFRYFRLAPERELRQLSRTVCVQGRCDGIFTSLLQDNLTQATEARLLAALSTAECLSSEIWRFVSLRWNESGRNHALLLQTLGAFPTKRNESALLLSNYLKSPRKRGRGALGSDTTRAIARLMIRLAPVSIKDFPTQLGQEILGLESTTEEPNLPSEAIATLRPAPVTVLKSAIQSSSETVRRQGLLAIQKLRPTDSSLIRTLLTEADEDSGDASGESFAKSVLVNMGDRTLPEIEKSLNNKALRTIAAEIVLLLRPGNPAAARTAIQVIPQLDCSRRLSLAALLPEIDSAIRAKLLECASELATTPKAVSKLGSLSDDEWRKILSALPQDNRLKASIIAEQLAPVMPARIMTEQLRVLLPDELEMILKALLLNPTKELLPLVEEVTPRLTGIQRLKAEALRLTLSNLAEEDLHRFRDVLQNSPTDDAVADILKERELMALNPLLVSRWSEPFWPMICRYSDERYLPALIKTASEASEELLPSLVAALACLDPEKALDAINRLSLFPSYTHLGKLKGAKGLIEALSKAAERSESRFEKSLHRQMIVKLQIR